MTKNTEHQIQSVSYDTIAEAFSKEARSLIPESVIEQILDKEKIRFENASLLDIPPEKLVRHNTTRYCKDLLRKQQPLPFLYFFLCFLTEISVWLIPYGIFIEICNYMSAQKSRSFTFPFLYGLFVIIGIVTGSTLSRQHLQNFLVSPAFAQKDKSSIQKAKTSLTRFRLLLFFSIIIFAGAAIILITVLSWYKSVSIGFSACFIAYVICILLSGIHNVIYSSHCLSFFNIGVLLLTRQPDSNVEAATNQYLNLRYLQMLSPSGKTLKALKKNPALEKELRKSLHSHMTTQRIYYTLAVIILSALDIICIVQFHTTTAPALACFFVLSMLCTFVFLFAFFCANHIFQCTK